MPTPDERLEVISNALAQLVREQRELKERIRILEERTGAVPVREPRPAAAPPFRETPAELPTPVVPETPAAEKPAPKPSPPVHPPPLPPPAELETKVGLNWLNRIAVITLVLGVGFLFKYGIDNDWLGPAARVVLGCALAIVSLAAGEYFYRREQPVFAQGATGLGLALFYLSFWAAAALYALVPLSMAFIGMSVTTLAAGVLALRYESQAVAVLGMIGGYITPAALSSGENHPWILFTYLFLLNLGGLVIARVRRWHAIQVLAAIATIVYYSGWYAEWFDDSQRPVATLFALAFYLQFATTMQVLWMAAQAFTALAMVAVWNDSSSTIAWLIAVAMAGLAVAHIRSWQLAAPWTTLTFWVPYWIAPTDSLLLLTAAFVPFFLWVAWRQMQSPPVRSADLAVLAGAGAPYFAAVYTLLNPDRAQWLGLIAITLGAAHVVLSRVLRGTAAERLALGIALAFVTVAVPIQFSGFRVTMAWALEGAALAWVASRYRQPLLSAGACLVLALMLLGLLGDAGMYTGIYTEHPLIANPRLLSFASAVASLWLASWFLKSFLGRGAGALYILGHVALLLGLGLEITDWVRFNVEPADRDSVNAVAISVLMTLDAAALIVVGVKTRALIHRVLGLALIAIVVAKLYLLDVWMLGRLFRITAFLALGALLLAVSYLYSRYKPVMQRLWKPDHNI